MHERPNEEIVIPDNFEKLRVRFDLDEKQTVRFYKMVRELLAISENGMEGIAGKVSEMSAYQKKMSELLSFKNENTKEGEITFFTTVDGEVVEINEQKELGKFKVNQIFSIFNCHSLPEVMKEAKEVSIVGFTEEGKVLLRTPCNDCYVIDPFQLGQDIQFTSLKSNEIQYILFNGNTRIAQRDKQRLDEMSVGDMYNDNNKSLPDGVLEIVGFTESIDIIMLDGNGALIAIPVFMFMGDSSNFELTKKVSYLEKYERGGILRPYNNDNRIFKFLDYDSMTKRVILQEMDRHTSKPKNNRFKLPENIFNGYFIKD